MEYAYLQSLGPAGKWKIRTHENLVHLKKIEDDPDSTGTKLSLLNFIGVGYIKQSKPDSSVIYLSQALPLARELGNKEMEGVILNNLGSAHKDLENWKEAEDFLQKSSEFNTALKGENAPVLAYTYFHLAGVMEGKKKKKRAKEYAEKARIIAEKNELTDLNEKINAQFGEDE